MSAKLAEFLGRSKLVILGRETCKFCRASKEALTEHKLPFAFVDCEKEDGGMEAFDAMTAAHQHDTMPAVFVDGKLLGGNSDVQDKLKSGELQKLLA